MVLRNLKYYWKISYHFLNIIEKPNLHFVWDGTTQNIYCNKKCPCTGKNFTIQVITLI